MAVSTSYATLCATLLYKKHGKNQKINKRGWYCTILYDTKKNKSKIPPTLTPTKIPFQKQCHHAIPRPRVHSLIVVLLRLATGRCGLIRPPVANYDLVIGHGILAGKYLAEYRDSLKQLFADVSGDRQSLGSFATSSQMMTEGRSHTW